MIQPANPAHAAWALALALALALGGGCAAPDPQEQAVQHVVVRYNAALAEGFRRMDMNALSSVATKDQATSEYYQMAALGEGKVQLIASLTDIRFTSTRITGDAKAVVETEEIWDYQQVSTETSAVVRVEKDVRYLLRYDLVREGGRWFVDKVTDIEGAGASGSQDQRPGAP